VNVESYTKQAAFFGALSHPTRLGILNILVEGESCVCHLSFALQLRQAYVSQQLAILRDAGLITDRKDGLYVYYGLAHSSIVRVLGQARRTLAHIAGAEQVKLPAQPPLRADTECPCPRCQARRLAEGEQSKDQMQCPVSVTRASVALSAQGAKQT
jgi:ArsR family transcriptional regulator